MFGQPALGILQRPGSDRRAGVPVCHLGLQIFHRQAAELAIVLAHLVIQPGDLLAVLLDLCLFLAQFLLGLLDLSVQSRQLARLELVPLPYLLYFQNPTLVSLIGLE